MFGFETRRLRRRNAELEQALASVTRRLQIADLAQAATRRDVAELREALRVIAWLRDPRNALREYETAQAEAAARKYAPKEHADKTRALEVQAAWTRAKREADEKLARARPVFLQPKDWNIPPFSCSPAQRRETPLEPGRPLSILDCEARGDAPEPFHAAPIAGRTETRRELEDYRRTIDQALEALEAGSEVRLCARNRFAFFLEPEKPR